MDDWAAEFQTSIFDCHKDRCPHRDTEGSLCHLRAGHPGKHDPLGASHFEFSHGTTWGVAP